jgi:hypothetical protein
MHGLLFGTGCSLAWLLLDTAHLSCTPDVLAADTLVEQVSRAAEQAQYA